MSRNATSGGTVGIGMAYLTRWLVPTVPLLLLLAARPAAQEDFTTPAAGDDQDRFGNTPSHADRARVAYKSNLERYKGAKDVLVLPGLVARRREKRVEIMAEATGMAEGAIVEFLLIDQSSNRGYEALLWSFARPSDVHKALVFIGMQPGIPYDPAGLRSWPKGERVILSVAADGLRGSLRLERMVLDKTKDEPLPEDGFVFTGSYTVPRRGDRSRRDYAADVLGAKSIASIFSDPAAVLDVPRPVLQSEVYGKLVVSSEYDFAANELVTIVLEPEYKDGRLRVKDLVLHVGRPSAAPAAAGSPGGARPLFVLTDAKGKTLTEKPSLPAALAALDAFARKGHDACVSVRFDAGLRLADVRTVCRVLAVIDVIGGVRIEPPAAGQLYYKAFLPNSRLLDRRKRVSQPWELRLVRQGGAITGLLAWYDMVYTDDKPDPELKVTRFDVITPEALRDRLDAAAARRKRAGKRPRAREILVFAEGELAYGRLVEFLGPALATHKAVHVFLDVPDVPDAKKR